MERSFKGVILIVLVVITFGRYVIEMLASYMSLLRLPTQTMVFGTTLSYRSKQHKGQYFFSYLTESPFYLRYPRNLCHRIAPQLSIHVMILSITSALYPMTLQVF